MKKNIIVIILIFVVTLGFFSGCIEEKVDGNDENVGNGDDDSEVTYDGDNYTWSIQKFMEEYNVEGNITAWEYYKTGITISYDTLEEGDTLIIKDKIPENISYDSGQNITLIPFTISYGRVQSTYNVMIKGDITDEFTPGTDFTLTVHIKHINVTAENFMGSGESIKLDWEVFQEQLNKDEEFFKNSLTNASAPFDEAMKPMDQSVIKRDHT